MHTEKRESFLRKWIHSGERRRSFLRMTPGAYALSGRGGSRPTNTRSVRATVLPHVQRACPFSDSRMRPPKHAALTRLLFLLFLLLGSVAMAALGAHVLDQRCAHRLASAVLQMMQMGDAQHGRRVPVQAAIQGEQ